MELIKQLLITFVKGYFLLLGLAMLIGGGICSAALPFLAFSNTTKILIPVCFIAFVSVSLLLFLIKNVSFAQQIKYLALLISSLFLVGGGLCFTGTTNSAGSQSIIGLLLLNIAIALSGYILMRWILTKNKPTS
jgi:hypothetical protein